MPNPLRSLRALVLVLALASTAAAQDPASPLWTIEALQSAKLGARRTVYVAVPDGYGASTTRYPVLVLLDANDRAQFNLALANAAFLANRGSIPQLIVVGIPNGQDRTHDLTPMPTGPTAARFGTAGGSSVFADFIVDEVLPLVRTKYRTLPTTLLAGHSFGGLFALEVAARRPSAFVGIIAMSPAMWWNDSSVVADYADAIIKSSVRQRLFVTSGGLEPDIDRTTQRFVRRLEARKPATVAFAYRHYADDTHNLTPAPSFVDGLRFMFEPLSLTVSPMGKLGASSDSVAVVRAVLETEAQYREGARYFGLPEKLPEQQLNTLGYNVLQELHKPGLAIWVFARNVALYPESTNVYDSLGDGYLAKGDTAEARAQFRKSVEVARSTGVPAQQETLEKLAKLERPK
jgi:predicted alpha/beta superfamily hydrolase